MESSAVHQANKAIFDGDLTALRDVIDAGLDVHLPFQHGNTLLRNAASSEDAAPLRLLLQSGADPNHRSFYRSPVEKRFEAGFTPLFYAQTAEAVSALIEHGADVNAVSEEGVTPLMRAGTAEIAKLLVEGGANVNGIDSTGTSPLMIAAKSARLDVASYLLIQGADPTLKQKYRRGRKTYTALRLAEEGLVELSKFQSELTKSGLALLDRYRRTVDVLRAAGAV